MKQQGIIVHHEVIDVIEFLLADVLAVDLEDLVADLEEACQDLGWMAVTESRYEDTCSKDRKVKRKFNQTVKKKYIFFSAK